MNRFLKYLAASFAAVALTAGLALAAVPWGTTNTVTPSGGNATCTSFASAPVCIVNLTGNLGGTLTLSGTPSPNAFTLVFMQDGTGSRTFVAPTNLVATSGTLPAIPSAANAYTVWTGHMVGSNYSVDATYDNLPMGGVFKTSFTSNGTAVANIASQAQPTIVAPGAALSNVCVANLGVDQPATWSGGPFLTCDVSTTNSVIVRVNNPTAATVTPTASTVNVILLPAVTAAQ